MTAPPPNADAAAVRDADLGAAEPIATVTDLDRTFARGLAWVGGVKWFVQAITWVTTVFVAQLLTPGDYGLLAMGGVLLTFITLFTDSGLSLTVVTVRTMSSEQLAQLNGTAIALGLLAFLTACALAIPAGRFYDQPAVPTVIAATSLTFIISSFRVIPTALLQRDTRFRPVAMIDGAQAVLQSAVTIGLALAGFRYWSLVWGGIAGATLSTVVTTMVRPFPIRRPRVATLRPVLAFTRDVFLARLFWYSYQNSDFIVAGKRLGSEALGAYSFAWTLASVPVDKITAWVGSVTAPMFAAVQEDRLVIRRYFLLVVEGLATVAFPLTVGVAAVAREFVEVVLGPRWEPMIIPLQLLASYAAIRTITPPANQVLVAIRDTRFQLWQNGIAAIALPLGFIVGSRWGTTGIGVVWIILHPLIIFIPLHVRVLRQLDIPVLLFVRALLPAIAGCFAMLAVIAMATPAVAGLSAPVRLSVLIGAGGGAYVSVALAMQRRRIPALLSALRSAPGNPSAVVEDAT